MSFTSRWFLGPFVLLISFLMGCGPDEDLPLFGCGDCPTGTVCRNGVCLILDAGYDASGLNTGEIVDNPDCPGVGVVISEFLPTPESGGPEFVEITGPENRDLTGFRLLGINGNGGSEYMDIALEGNLGSAGMFLIASDAIPGADQLNQDLILQNGPDNLWLLDCGGQVIDSVGYGDFDDEMFVFYGEGAPAVDPETGTSLARCPDAETDLNDNFNEFHLSYAPTPGEMNDAFADPYACEPCIGGTFDGQVMINEIFYNPEGADSVEEEFLELSGVPGLDLFGISLVLVNGSTGESYSEMNLSGVLDTGSGLFTLGGTGGDMTLATSLQNGPDGVRLLDCEGSIVDEVGYGQFGEEDTVIGEGSPAPAVSEGFSLARCSVEPDTNDNTLDFREAVPSPGLENTEFVDPRSCGGDLCPEGVLEGRLSISEYFGANGGATEFIELVGDSRMGLADVTLEILDGEGSVINQYLLESGEQTDSSGYWVIETEELPLDSGTLLLASCDGSELDALAWGEGSSLVGEGAPAEIPQEGEGLSRCSEGEDTQENLFDFHLSAVATPAEPNRGFLDPSVCGEPECVSGALTGQVVINEVLYDPAGADSEGATFIELRGAAGLDLSLARLVERSGSDCSESDLVELRGQIDENGYFIVGSNLETGVDNSADTDLTNSRGGVDLYDCEGVLVDAIAYETESSPVCEELGEGGAVSGAATNGGESLARCPFEGLDEIDTDDNVVDFHRSVIPTPGDWNFGFVDPVACGFVCVPGGLDGRIWINELSFGADGFIELSGLEGVQLEEVVIELLDPSGTYLERIELHGDDQLNEGGFLFLETEASQPAGGTALLLDCDGRTVDSLSWGEGVALTGEGTPAISGVEDHSLSRCEGFADTDDNESDFNLSATPSPGEGNSGYVDSEACALPESALSGLLMINELMVDPVGANGDGLTFLEIRGESGMDLTGLLLVSFDRNDGTQDDELELSGVFPETGLLLIGQDESGASGEIFHIHSDFAQLVNVGGAVALLDDVGLKIDAMAYGEVLESLAEGLPAEGAGSNAGESLARCSGEMGTVDTDDNSLDFYRAELPTPGAENTGLCTD